MKLGKKGLIWAVFWHHHDWLKNVNNLLVPRYRFVDKHMIEVYLGNIGRY